ncbi:MAG: leucine-rich repeat domain-containing protein [Ruminococcus sp.]|jgi:hypothetical protein|nr:leucine-rich repeat domain-containing protein [Ruminococcus sp.]
MKKIKKLTTLIVSIVMLITTSVTTSTTTIDLNDGDIYEQTVATTTLNKVVSQNGDWEYADVSGVGCMLTKYQGNDKSVTIPEKIDEKDVVGVYKYGFQKSDIEHLTFSKTLQYFDDYAVFNCKKLKDITVPEENTKFTSKDGVLFNAEGSVLIQYPIGNERTTYEVPDDVWHIYAGAFAYATNLESVKMPQAMFSLANWAFAYCDNLKNFTVSAGITKISEKAFVGCKSIETLQLPTELTVIDKGAFLDCKKLKNLVVPANVTLIDQSAFAGCTDLSNVEFAEDNKLETIAEMAFTDCRSLLKVRLQGNASIGEFAFGYFAERKSSDGSDETYTVLSGFELEGNPGSLLQTYAKTEGIPYTENGAAIIQVTAAAPADPAVTTDVNDGVKAPMKNSTKILLVIAGVLLLIGIVSLVAYFVIRKRERTDA